MKKRIQLSDHFSYKQLIRFTIPTISMMIFTSIYSVVDGLFVSNFAGKTPFAAINIIMPFLMIVATVGLMFGTGGSAIVAKSFGERKNEQANRQFSLFVYAAFILSILFAVLGLVFIEDIAKLLGAKGNEELLKNATQYASIILIALPFNVLQMMFQSFFVTAEKPKLGLAVTFSAGMTNIILDAILVISLPANYKLAGAAIATAVSQTVGGVLPLIYFSRKNNSLLRLGKATLDWRAILNACTNGSSEFMSNISMNVVGILYNQQLLKYAVSGGYAEDDGVAAYGVMMYVSMIFSATFLGYSIGTAPIIGYHYGAKNHDELKGLLKKSLIMIGLFGIFMILCAEVLASPLAKLFVGSDPKLKELTVSGFRIFSLSFMFMGYAIYSSGFFTALGDGLTSALISFLRTLVFQIAAVVFLPMLLGIDGIWYSIVVAELMAVIFSAFFLVLKRKKYKYF